MEEGERFVYEQDEVETGSTDLQFVLDTLYNLAEAYPQIKQMGGEAVPQLQPVAGNKKHPAQTLAAQLIKEIAATTEPLRRQGVESLVCPRCLTRFSAHQAEIGWVSSVAYYGCRTCHQSKEFFTVDKVIAVLDNQVDFAPVQHGQTLSVNWVFRRELFDFDSVRILRATDEEVERFAVQVGNDTDPLRQPWYQKMECTASPDCNLSANTTRILQRTFPGGFNASGHA